MKALAPVALAAAAALVLAGCSTEPPPADDATLGIVASTNVYGSIAEARGR